MSYFEVITDAHTGEQTVRPFSPDEVAAIEAAQAAALAAEREAMSLTFAQLLIGLVSEGWITAAEGRAWRDRVSLPAPVAGLIAGLPESQQFAAETRALAPSVVLRTDPLVVGLGLATGKTAEQIDAFFRTYSGV